MFSRFKLNHRFTVSLDFWEGCGYLIHMHVFPTNSGSSNSLKMLQNKTHKVRISIFASLSYFGTVNSTIVVI